MQMFRFFPLLNHLVSFPRRSILEKRVERTRAFETMRLAKITFRPFKELI